MLTNVPQGAAHRRWVAHGARSGQGFVLPTMLIVGLVVTLGAATLTSRALSLRLGEGLQDQATEARDAADSGFEAVIAELNREENRQLAGSNVSMNNWGSSTAALRNPCLLNTDGSPANTPVTNTATSLRDGSWQTLPNNPNLRYRIRSATVKNAARSAWISTRLFSSSDGTPIVTTAGTYDPSKIRTAAETEQFSRLELSIEGQSLRNGEVISSRVITQELGVVPKCCGASIGDTSTSLTQLCASRFPSLLIGLNGGGMLRAGSGAQLRELPEGSLTLSNTVQRPARVLCVNNSGTCGGTVTDSVDTVPIQTIRLQPPSPPAYPERDNRTGALTGANGFEIVSNSITDSADRSAANDTRSQRHQDYLRVNSSGQVELCNVTDNNLTEFRFAQPNSPESRGEPNLPASFVANSCDNRINSFCARTGDSEANYTYHCRIARLHVRDDSFAGNCEITSTSTSDDCEDDRIQNNTFYVDSSRGRIFLHFNAAWISPLIPPERCGGYDDPPTQDAICTQYRYDDGQIQHLYCATPPDDSIPCGTKALPDNAPRAALYSDTTTSLKIGDDGFIRDLFIYMPRGTLTLAEDPNRVDNAYGVPNFRGPLWINNLSMGAGINPTYQIQIAAPAFSSSFQGLGTPSIDNPFRLLPFFEWIVRGSSLRNLYGAG